MNVEPLRLEAGEVAGDGLEGVANRIEMVQALPQTEGGEIAAVPAAETGAEDRRYLVGGEPPQAEFATALEHLVDRKVALEDEVAAILDLSNGIEAGQVDLFALLGGEFRPQHQGPIVEPLANDVRAQPIGGGLQRGNIVHRQECIVVLSEADLRTGEFPFDEAVTVEV